MNDAIIVSAPGKLMLFGEHAVVYGRPCIVTAVNQRLSVKAEKIENPEFQLSAPGVGIVDYQKKFSQLGQDPVLKAVRFVEMAIKFFIAKHPIMTGVKIQVNSEFESTYGFGSSSAVTVCTIRALAELFDIRMSAQQIFDLSYKTVLEIQGSGSGADLAAALYGGTLYYISPGKTIKPIKIQPFSLIVGYTGVKADTSAMIKTFSHYKAENPQMVEQMFSDIENIVDEASRALVENDMPKLGKLMNSNQKILERMGVSSLQLDALISSANDAGAYGAKLSGAGGGDCMIALTPPSKKSNIEAAIQKAGGQILKVEINAQGVI